MQVINRELITSLQRQVGETERKAAKEMAARDERDDKFIAEWKTRMTPCIDRQVRETMKKQLHITVRGLKGEREQMEHVILDLKTELRELNATRKKEKAELASLLTMLGVQ